MRKTLEILTQILNAKVYYFAIVLAVILCNTSFGQSITWQRTILAPDIEYFTSVVQTPDEGYIAVGRKRESGISDDMYIVRFNKYGDTLWSKTVDVELAECIIKTLDNNYLICGHEGSLVKINPNGDILQIRPFLGYDFLIINTVLQTNNGNFFICGTFRSNLDSPYLAKYDSNLNLIFDSIYNANRFDGQFNKIIIGSDSTLVLVGNHKILVNSPYHLFLSKIDQFGNVIWENTYTQQINLYPKSIVMTNGNNFIVGGFKFLAKFNSIGNNVWYQKIDSLFNNLVIDIKPTNDNYFIMSGWLYDGNSAFARMRKIDSNGSTIWVRSHGFKNQNNEGRAIQQTLDSGFIVAGITDLNSEDTYLLKTDSEGNLNPIGINIISTNFPYSFELFQNYPNPFNPKTTIKFNIPFYSKVKLEIFDVLGRQLETLIDRNLLPAEYSIDFKPGKFSSGIYFYTLTATNSKNLNYKSTKKFIIIK